MSRAPLRVAVVDDTADLRELLRLGLTRSGMEVVGEAADGRAGIELVRAHRPDVVLLDLSMPVMDGMEALPHIRALVPEATVIVLSGFGAAQMADRAVANGASGYLQKGLSIKRLIEDVHELAGRDGRTPELHVVPDRSEAPDLPAPSAAVVLAPYGVVEVAPAEPWNVLVANSAAERILGSPGLVGRPLGQVVPGLAEALAAHAGRPEAVVDVLVGPRSVRATLRRTQRSALLYLDPAPSDAHTLQHAIATAAHEIRGPVAVLSGLAEAITEPDFLDEAERDRLLGSVARQVRLLDSITADLLTAAQVERGTLRVDPAQVYPQDLVETVVADRHGWSESGISLVVEDARPVHVDPLRFEQMLVNLLSNANKYGRPPIEVRISAHPHDPGLLDVSVTDSGPGVPADFRDRLFREFSRAPGTAATGTGLGLHVVRTLAEAHGGEASYSTGADGGAVFTVSLPVVQVEGGA